MAQNVTQLGEPLQSQNSLVAFCVDSNLIFHFNFFQLALAASPTTATAVP